MSRVKTKNHAIKDSLGEVRETVKVGRYGPQGVVNVLQGGVTSGTNFWIRDVGTIGGNRDTHGVSDTYNKEASAMDSRRDMGDNQGGSSTGSYRKSVGDKIHRETTWKYGTVGGVADNLLSVCSI